LLSVALRVVVLRGINRENKERRSPTVRSADTRRRGIVTHQEFLEHQQLSITIHINVALEGQELSDWITSRDKYTPRRVALG
jgi:hypothetical protein